MEKRTLQPQQIIVPGEYELGNESILRIYFRVFSKGYGEALPPVIVARSDLIGEKERAERLERFIENEESWLRKFRNDEIDKRKIAKEIADKGEAYRRLSAAITRAQYYLIDGNHKTAAATLANAPIYALELQFDEDITKARKMVEEGELFDFKMPEQSLRELVLSFEEYLLGSEIGGDYHIEDLRTVQERVDELVCNKDLPQYMIDRYLRKH